MRFPLSMTLSIAAYVAKKKVTRAKKFPMVLMLEPLHACNLTCTGCGRIREYEATIKQKMSIDECLAAVDECGAPVVSLCGGEPMIYPGIGELTAKILERKKSVILCTNGMFIKKKIDEFKPSNRFFFNIHLDGMRETHDIAVERQGVFDDAIEGIKVAKEAGFLVCSNTTVYKETMMSELDDLFAYLTSLDVDGFMISPRLQLRGCRLEGNLYDPRRHPREIPRCRGHVQEIQVQHVADLLGVSPRQTRNELHGLGQPDPQYQRLEGTLLFDHRYSS